MTTTTSSQQQTPTMASPKTYLNFIGGEWRPSASGETFDDTNPAHPGQVVARFQRSSTADVDAALTAAERALSAWRDDGDGQAVEGDPGRSPDGD